MKLSSLIHKSKSKPFAAATVATPATDGGAVIEVTVANVASVAVANSTDSKNPGISVTVWTPAGNPMQVQAKDAAHAAFLVSMNPKPEQTSIVCNTGGNDGKASTDSIGRESSEF